MTDTDRKQMYHDTAGSIPLGRICEVEDVGQAYLEAYAKRSLKKWSARTARKALA